MKSNRWWIRGTKLRVLKKHGKVYHNGTLFGWNEWEKQLNLVRTLKVGDKIFNPFLGSYTKVKQVSYRWSYKTPWVFPRLRGSCIIHFAILDDHGYLIHEIGEE